MTSNSLDGDEMASRKKLAPYIIALAFVAVAPIGAARGCSPANSNVDPALDAGSDIDGSKDAYPDRDRDAPPSQDVVDAPPDVQPDRDTTDADAGCGKSIPADVPPNWIHYDNWSCDCEFYVPGEKGELPPPFQWVPCPSQAPSGINCRMMRVNGFVDLGGTHSRMVFDPATNQNVIATLMRRSGSLNVTMTIAEVDGLVRTAFYHAFPWTSAGCAMVPGYMNGTRFALNLYGSKDTNKRANYDAEGVAVGALADKHPKVFFASKNIQDSFKSWNTSDRWLIERTAGYVKLYDWSDGLRTEHRIYPSNELGNLDPFEMVFHANDVFFVTSGGGVSFVNAYSPEHGTRGLLNWWNEGLINEGAGGFGTDGKDMAWIWASERLPGGGYHEYAKFSVVTAKYTTDPEVVKRTQRVLWTEPTGSLPLSFEGFKVGCGYAARADKNLRVYRLADGAQWKLPPASTRNEFEWGSVLGVSCDEVFADVGVSKEPELRSIVRVRLDSLGVPQMPPTTN